MFNKKRALTAAVLLSCSFFMAPYYAHAEEEEPSCDHPSSYITIEAGNLTYNFDIYTASTHPGEHWRGEYTTDENGQKIKEYATYRDLFTGEEQVFSESISYIHNLINPSGTTNPTIKLELLPPKDANAAAQSETYITYKDNGTPVQISDTELAAVLQGKYQPEDKDIVAEIEVDLAPEGSNWYIERFPSLPSNGTDSDYYGTITHEMFHALGLGTYISNDSSGKVTFGTSGNYDDNGYDRSMAVFNKYEMGIRDVFNRVVYYSVTYDQDLGNATYTYYDDNPIKPNDKDDWNRINGELISRDIVPITLEQFNDRNFVKKEDEFYVLKGEEVSTNSGTYFTGVNVEKVLTTKNAATGLDELAEIPWPDGSEAPAVPGLPLNGYEGDETTPELSHIELQNCLMSHQSYRNWCNFTEAELAILQDLGFNVDRGAYYGKSIYNSGITFVNEQGFYNRIQDEDGNWYYGTEPNTTMHGTGLHIYGSNNIVTQKGTILADGFAANGIRVDGVGNKLTIDSNITANGDYGNGLLVAYGKEHEITLNANKTIEATGADGVAARFDFGSNELGDIFGYRGSYINTSYTSQEEIDEREAERPGSSAGMQVGWSEITEDDVPDAIQGALVENFNVAGNLIGSKAAIYISPNAYVKNINILKGAEIEGDIISEWNPNAIIYQNGNIDDLDDDQILKPALPYDEDGDREAGLTHLNFGCKNGEDGNLVADSTFYMELNNNITGSEGLVIDLWGGELITSGTNDVNIVHVAEVSNTQYTNTGNLTINSSLVVDGSFVNNGKLQTSFDEDGESLKISGTGSAQLTGTEESTGTFVLNAEQGFYKGTTYIDLINGAANIPEISIDDENILVNSNSASLKMSAEFDGDSIITITTLRDYTSLASTSGEAQLAQQLVLKADEIANNPDYTGDSESLSPIDQKWQNIITGMDYNDSTGATAKQAMKALTPHVYNSSAQATLNTHTMLNNLNMLGSFSNNVPAARTGGGRGPAADDTPKHNSWRNIVVPFSSYTDQHNGVSSYTNHNSGVLGAMERTLDNGLTHGYHAAVNHQSTSSASQRIKGEGFYLGTHASYAPADWKGWQVFGSARLGLENMRSHRNFVLGGGSFGRSDADWTGFSGSFTVGTALEKEHGVVKSGPFAALGYSFAHRPSVDEHGGGIPAHLDGATYDSLQTQLGYRLTTAPKALDNYDSTKWQAHASVAWNHELLNDNGSTDFALEGLSKSMNDKTADYGRDSMNIAAGITFKTPKRLDVGLTLGSDIYRKGGSSVYGKVNFEWKF